MSRQTEQMWAALLQAGLVQGAAPATGKSESPWYVKVLLALSGWFAAFFLLGFIGMAFEYVFRNSTASFILGGAMIGGAFAILRIPKNEFVEHLALAVSLAGQFLVVVAFFKITRQHENIGWLLVVLLQVPLALVMPNFVHRAFSSFFAAFALNMALTYWGWPFVASGVVMFLAAWCWLNEFSYPQQMRSIRAIGYGLVLALVLLKGMALFGYQTMGWFFHRAKPEIWIRPWMGEVLTCVVAFYVVWQLLQRHGQHISQRIAIPAILGTLLLCAVSMKVQGLTVGMVIMLLGFSGANRVLLGLGIVSLLSYISYYYYLLDVTLLVKSGTLLAAGVALLGMRWLLITMMPKDREADHV
ncbi:MAG: DUF4401 domain-containing protein [Desulfobulbaceae bacterium]|nr:DUF4401 domain-containing protein [Desulfobulbaceae bacterium]